MRDFGGIPGCCAPAGAAHGVALRSRSLYREGSQPQRRWELSSPGALGSALTGALGTGGNGVNTSLTMRSSRAEHYTGFGDWLGQHGISQRQFCRDTGIDHHELKRIIDKQIDPRGSTVSICLAYAALHGGGLHINGLLSQGALDRVVHAVETFHPEQTRVAG